MLNNPLTVFCIKRLFPVAINNGKRTFQNYESMSYSKCHNDIILSGQLAAKIEHI